MSNDRFAPGVAHQNRADCAVRALSNALDIPYADAYFEMAEAGRRSGRGTPMRVTEAAFKARGFRLHRFDPQNMPRTIATLGDFIASRGIYLVRLKRHIFAVRDGVIYEPASRQRRHVRALYRVEEISNG